MKGKIANRNNVHKLCLKDLSFFLAIVICGMWFIVNSALGQGACPKPEKPVGGGSYAPQNNFYNVNDSVLYGCPTQLNIFGNKSRTCLPSGTWSDSLPSCGCLKPASPLGGAYFNPQKSIYLVNDSIHQGCRRELHLFGSKVRHCLRNGTWNGTEPYCVQKSQIMRNEHYIMQLFDNKNGTCLFGNTKRVISLFVHIKGKFKLVIIQLLYKFIHDEISVYYIRNNQERQGVFNFLGSDRHGNTLNSTWFSYTNSTALIDPRVEISIGACHDNSNCQICEVLVFNDIEIECSERPPELKNAKWSNWEDGQLYPVNTTLEALCKYGYTNYHQPITVICNATGSWSPEFLKDVCQEQSTFSLPKTVIIAVAAVGLLLVLLCLGVCIFWRRRGINKRSKKTIHQAEVLLDNPVYKSTSPSLQGKEWFTEIYLQPQINNKDTNKQYSCDSNKEVTNIEMATNEIYLAECPVAKAIYEYDTSDYAEVNETEQSKPTLTSQRIEERPMQELVVENEIYGMG